MICPECGEHHAVCECIDGVDEMSDLQLHNKGLCNSFTCRFCEEEMDDE